MKKTLSQFKMPLSLALLVLGCFTVEAASTLGFNYWPTGYDCGVLNNANWTTANKAIIQRELDHMASLGGGVIRLVVHPQSSGWWLQTTCPTGGGSNGPGGSIFCPNFTEQTANVVDMIGLCKARNMKVIIAFANYFQGPTNSPTYWANFYGSGTTNYTHFLWDVQHWIDGFVDSIEASANASSVLYYDIQNEYDAAFPYSDWYSTFVFDWSTMPALKKGHSVLSLADAQSLSSAMGSRVLKFTDFHCYPTMCPADQAILENYYDSMRGLFPSSQTIMGEFGRWAQYTTDEANQNCTVKDVASRAKTKGILYHLHWLFMDKEFNNQNYFGLGYSTHYMKDTMGGLSSVENLIYNPDMELPGTGAPPTSWGFGSSTGNNTTFTAGGPSSTDARTNLYYGRITRTAASGSVWMNVPTFAVTGTSGKKLYVNFFLRSSMTNIYPAIHEYDANWNPLGTLNGASYTPPTWTWYNYLAVVGTQSFTLASGTKNIIISIIGTSTSNPSYLDVDTISAFEQ